MTAKYGQMVLTIRSNNIQKGWDENIAGIKYDILFAKQNP